MSAKSLFNRSLLCTGLLCLGTLAANAALLVYDPFNYSPVGADLTNQSPDGGATLWNVTGTNGVSGTDPITIAGGSLSIAGLAPSIGNSITYGGLGLTNRISLGSIFTSGTLYYSFALQVTDLSNLSTTGGFLAGFNTSIGDQAAQPSQVGARVVTRASGTGGFQVGVDKSSGGAMSFVMDPTIFNLGDTIFVVGSYTFISGGTTNDEARMWVNPDPSTFGLENAPPTSLFSTAINDVNLSGAIQIQSFLFRQGNATAVPNALIADELRVGTTWADVTPAIPEPSAVMLLSLVGSAGLFLRRRGLRG